MADVEIKYKDAVIATLNETGTKTLKTSGKYCEDDITVSYTKSAVPAETNYRHYEYDNPAAVSGSGNYVTIIAGDEQLASIREEESLIVIFRAAGEAACTKSGVGTNMSKLLPIYNSDIHCQAVNRLKSDGSIAAASITQAVNDDTNISAGSGRIYITPEGDLRIYGNTNSYPILAGKVIVEVIW